MYKCSRNIADNVEVEAEPGESGAARHSTGRARTAPRKTRRRTDNKGPLSRPFRRARRVRGKARELWRGGPLRSQRHAPPRSSFSFETDQGPYVGICSVVARATREMGAALRQVGARGAVSVHPHVLILFAIAFT